VLAFDQRGTGRNADELPDAYTIDGHGQPKRWR
jgi:hypothetical protein